MSNYLVYLGFSYEIGFSSRWSHTYEDDFFACFVYAFLDNIARILNIRRKERFELLLPIAKKGILSDISTKVFVNDLNEFKKELDTKLVSVEKDMIETINIYLEKMYEKITIPYIGEEEPYRNSFNCLKKEFCFKFENYDLFSMGISIPIQFENYIENDDTEYLDYANIKINKILHNVMDYYLLNEYESVLYQFDE